MIRIICICFFTCTSILMFGQVPATWTYTDSCATEGAKGIVLNETDNILVVWGEGDDPACLVSAVGLTYLDTAGVLLRDTIFELNNCANEDPVECIVSNQGPGVFLFTQNNVITPADSSYCYYVDINQFIPWSVYVGEDIRSRAVYYDGIFYMGAEDISSGKYVIKTHESGNATILNYVIDPYFYYAPPHLLVDGGLVYEIASRGNILDTALLCYIYDTAGNYVTTFSFDADASNEEQMQHVFLRNNQLFHVSRESSINRTYPACTGTTGIVNWIDTIYHDLHGYNAACIDTINEVGYILCNLGGFVYKIFSYDLISGTLIDSIQIDSVSITLTGIKSGPVGGVYFMYNKRFINEITLDQYDKNLDLMWRGVTTHPTCTSACTPQDFIIDSVGYVYTVSNCGACDERVLVSKYSPSLVGITKPGANENIISIFPSPAQEQVTITLNDAEGPNNTISIYNSSGQLINYSIFSGTSITLEIANYASGLYFIEVTTDTGQRFTNKLIIQHAQ